MASFGFSANVADVDTDKQFGNYENLPDGNYMLEVSKSEIKPNNAGTGKIINLQYSVLEPIEYKDRVIFSNLNIVHDNPKTEEFGLRDLLKLCRAVGLSAIPETEEELWHISFPATVGLGKPSKELNSDGTPKFAARNEIKKFFYPDSDAMPDIGITGTVAANDNVAPKRAAANDNRAPARQAATGGAAPARSWSTSKPAGGGKPWPTKAAPPAQAGGGGGDDDIPF